MEFNELFQQVYPDLFRYGHRLTGDADAADDLAQEAFVRLLRHEVDGEDPALRAWLFKVVTHLVRDRARSASNQRRLLEANPVLPSASPDPRESIERETSIARVRQALDELPDRDREILLMREEGFAYQEIAEAIDVAAASVGTLLARARRRLAEALGEEAARRRENDPLTPADA